MARTQTRPIRARPHSQQASEPQRWPLLVEAVVVRQQRAVGVVRKGRQGATRSGRLVTAKRPHTLHAQVRQLQVERRARRANAARLARQCTRRRGALHSA